MSHLPHALAFALVGELAARPDADECFGLAGERVARFHAPGRVDRRKCGATSVSPTAMRCARNSMPIASALGRVDALLAASDGAALLRCSSARAAPARTGSSVHAAATKSSRLRDLRLAVVKHYLDLAPVARMAGTVRLPGSKSISNRTLLLAALARGDTEVAGLLDADDVARHARARCARWASRIEPRAGTRDFCVHGGGGAFPVKRGGAFSRQRRHGGSSADRRARAWRRRIRALRGARACTNARSAIWSMRCAQSAPRSATWARRAFRRSRSARATLHRDATGSRCAATCRASF